MAPTTPPPRLLNRPPSRRLVDATAVAVGIGLGASVALAVSGTSSRSLSAPGGWTTFFGRVAGLSGTYLLLVMILLIARIPWVERAVGQDRLVRWHRNLGQWPVYLLILHAALIILGYSEAAHTGVVHQTWILIDSYPDVLMAIVALGLIVTAAVASIRAARRRMRYETWWNIHLYMYLALALSFSHQIANGQSFVGHPLTRYVWAALWAATAGTVVVFRFIVPIGRTMWHGLRVVGVTEEVPGVISIVCSGRHVERLGASGGQFFQWRFLHRGLWWRAHPFSLSAMPRPPYLRFTVKTAGDKTEAMAHLPVGTRVAIEGPYGAFTRHQRYSDKVLLIGAGVGVTPIRALLEDLDRHVDVVVITRASTPDDLLLDGEIRALAARRGDTLHELVGSRRQYPLDARHLRRLVPDIAKRDTYICGPEALNAAVLESLRDLGVAEERIHCEQFAF